jgi:hypothetical protein
MGRAAVSTRPTVPRWYAVLLLQLESQTRANLREVGIEDGDWLDAIPSSLSGSSSDNDEQWLAQLAAAEDKIIQLQDEVEFKHAELKAAVTYNEIVCKRVSSIRSALNLLRRQKRRERRRTRP